MRSADFQPLRVTAWLQCGVVSDAYLPLDGILLYQAMRDRYGARVTSAVGQQGSEEHRHASVPLAICERDIPHWYYACSFAQPARWWAGEGQDAWNKRFDAGLAHLIDFDGKRPRVLVESGKYRAYHMPLFYRVAPKIEWFCVGDAAGIEYLLSTVTHIGKKQDMGWGRVTRWQVEPWPHDWSVWRQTDGEQPEPMRAVPVAGRQEFWMGWKVMLYGFRPPYWLPENQATCIVP
jgi:CRISPR type IV-associated protein Csf3